MQRSIRRYAATPAAARSLSRELGIQFPPPECPGAGMSTGSAVLRGTDDLGPGVTPGRPSAALNSPLLQCLGHDAPEREGERTGYPIRVKASARDSRAEVENSVAHAAPAARRAHSSSDNRPDGAEADERNGDISIVTIKRCAHRSARSDPCRLERQVVARSQAVYEDWPTRTLERCRSRGS